MSLPHLHHRVDTSGSQCLLWNPCCQIVFTRVQHIQISPWIPRVERTYWEFTWGQDMVVVIFSCWHPLRRPYFIRFWIIDWLSSLFKPEWACLLRWSQLSLFELLLNASSWARWMALLSWVSLDHDKFSAATQAPFYQNLHVTVFTPVSSVGGWNLGILSLWSSWAAWPPPTNLTPLTLLVPLSPSGGSSVINPSLVQTPRPDQTPLFPPACVSSPILTANFI